ncbi:MAG: tetratricopeptide repeat protein [Candidatus Nanopelagicales bacterium]
MSAQNPPPAGPPSGNVPLHGAVDLAALAQSREAAKQAQERTRAREAAIASGEAVPGAFAVVDVTEATFEAEVVQRSFQVPVVVDLWATWCQPCKQLSPILEKLAEEGNGSWVLAKVDVDAEPNIATAFQVQSIPSVIALVKGQPVPLFQGALPEPQVRKFMEELVKVAGQAELTGLVAEPAADGSAEAAEPTEEVDDPRYDAAYDAFETGDWDAAQAAYESLLADAPGDADAAAGLVRVRLMRRTDGADAVSALAAAAAQPADVEAAKLAADFEMLEGQPAAAFDRLIEAVRLTSGDERAAVREHLVGLFDIVGATDPDVVQARTKLANALF